MVHAKLLIALVDVGSQRGYTQRLAFVHQLGYFRNLILASTHDGRHELSRIVSLEVCRLKSHPRIAGRMRLVEGIGCKLLPVGPYLVQHVLIISVLLAAFDKLGFHGIYYRLFLLTHRLTQGVTLTTREIGQQAREQHHLLLINGDAVGIFQIPLHHRNGIRNLLLSFLTGDERRDVVHGTRAVEGVHGDEIFKLRRT